MSALLLALDHQRLLLPPVEEFLQVRAQSLVLLAVLTLNLQSGMTLPVSTEAALDALMTHSDALTVYEVTTRREPARSLRLLGVV